MYTFLMVFWVIYGFIGLCVFLLAFSLTISQLNNPNTELYLEKDLILESYGNKIGFLVIFFMIFCQLLFKSIIWWYYLFFQKRDDI